MEVRGFHLLLGAVGVKYIKFGVSWGGGPGGLKTLIPRGKQSMVIVFIS